MSAICRQEFVLKDLTFLLKGLVHQKITNSVINYWPSCRSKPVRLRSSSEHKLRYFWLNPCRLHEAEVLILFPQWRCTAADGKRWRIKSFFFFSHTKYSRSFVKLRLNPWCHVDYFTDVLATFMDLGTLQLRCCLWSIWEILDLIKNILKNIRWTKVLRVWNDMRVSNQCQNFNFWVNYLFKIKIHEVKLACKHTYLDFWIRLNPLTNYFQMMQDLNNWLERLLFKPSHSNDPAKDGRYKGSGNGMQGQPCLLNQNRKLLSIYSRFTTDFWNVLFERRLSAVWDFFVSATGDSPDVNHNCHLDFLPIKSSHWDDKFNS